VSKEPGAVQERDWSLYAGPVKAESPPPYPSFVST